MIRRGRSVLAGVADATLVRRLATVGAALLVVLLSCGEPTAPRQGDGTPRFARGFTFNTVFPELAGSSAFASAVEFNRVHIQLHRAEGGVALDSTVIFPPGVESLSLSFDVRLTPGTLAAGELLSLNLAYLNAAGTVVFTGGPISIVAVPSIAGAPRPAPVTVPVVYTGPGSAARTVRISPRTLAVNAGAPFAFSAEGLDAAAAIVAGAPILYTVLDPSRATLATSAAGAGTALGVRGTARIVARLINGAADTATLTVRPVASAITVVSGSGQAGIVGKPSPRTLAQPLVVRVTAADGLGVEGVPVSFAASNGGAASPATATTDANGDAQTSWTLGLTALSQTVTATAAGLGSTPVLFAATGQTMPATKLSLMTGPAAGSSIASGAPIGVVVTALDADGDPVTSFNGTVSASLGANPGGAALSGTASLDAVGGVASFTALNIIKPGAGYALDITSGSLAAVATPAFDIVPGPAAGLVLLGGGGQTMAAGSALTPVTALVIDAHGNAKYGIPVTFSVASGGGAVTPATVISDAQGHASATWTLGSVVGGQTLGIASGGTPSLTVTATAFSAVQTWVITQQPGASIVAGAPIVPGVVAELHDAVNALVTGFNGSVTAGISGDLASAKLGGTASVTAVNGVATFTDLSVTKAGAEYSLAVSSRGATSATTTPFSVVAGAAASISIASGNAQSAVIGAALSQPVVALVTDANGNAKAGVAVAFTVTGGAGNVSVATGTTDVAGRVSTAWTLGTTVGAHTLNITSAGLPTVSAVATATATSTVASWAFTSHPGTSQQVAGAPVSPVVVAELRNAGNEVVTSFTGSVTLALGANPGGATLGGATTVTAVNGVATFTNVILDKAGNGYSLVVSSAGGSSATSAVFNVGAGPASAISIFSGNGQTAPVNTALGQPVTALVTDANGNVRGGVAIAVAVIAGAGSVAPSSGVTDESGRFITTWTLGATSGEQTLAMSTTGLPAILATATGTNVVRALVITTQPPATLTAGAAMVPALAVEMRDENNTIVPSYSGPIALTLGAGGAPLGSVNAIAGVASFPNVIVKGVGTDYTLVASSSGATSATSTPFSVTAGAASALTLVTGNAQVGTFGSVLPLPVVARVTDAYGNIVAGAAVTFAVTSGGGTVATASMRTGPGGLASTTWTLGFSGSQTLSVTSVGPPVTVSASGTPISGVRIVPDASFPTSVVVGGAPASFSVRLVDAVGTSAAQPNTIITATVTAQPSATSWSLTAVANANGVATFTQPAYVGPTGTATVTFTAPGIATLTSPVIQVIAGAASGLRQLASLQATVAAGAVLTPQPMVQVVDVAGNAVATNGLLVTASVATGGGTLGGVTSVPTNASGQAAFADLSVSGLTGIRTLRFSGGTLTPGTSAAVTIGIGTITKMVANTGVPSGTVGAQVDVAPSVKITDTFGNAASGVAVTFTTSSGAKLSNGIITGTSVTVTTDVSGIARVASWTLGTIVQAYRVSATASVSTGSPVILATTATPGALASIAVTPNPVSLLVGATQQFGAAGRDVFGNVVAMTPAWSVVNGGGTINSAGLFTAGATAATYTGTIRATSGAINGLANVTLVAGPVASIVVSPASVTLAPGEMQQFMADGRDAQGNVVTITPVWTVASGGGSISGSGLLTAASTAGSFIDGVRATSGTLSGSAALTIASLTVTPASLSPVKIVLSSSQLPHDFASHLTGPDGTVASKRFHVYYSAKGSCAEPPFACHDKVAKDGRVSETITVSKVMPGVYRYTVQNDDDDRGKADKNTTFSKSASVVNVYIANVLVKTFAAPVTQGSSWVVFELTGNTIMPINQIAP